MTLQKQDENIRPIHSGEIWSHCFVNLTVNVTSVHNEEVKLFSSTYDNFIQTTGIRDGVSHCAKILVYFNDNLDTSDPNVLDVIIKIEMSNSFNTTDRARQRIARRDNGPETWRPPLVSRCDNCDEHPSVTDVLNTSSVTTTLNAEAWCSSLAIHPVR